MGDRKDKFLLSENRYFNRGVGLVLVAAPILTVKLCYDAGVNYNALRQVMSDATTFEAIEYTAAAVVAASALTFIAAGGLWDLVTGDSFGIDRPIKRIFSRRRGEKPTEEDPSTTDWSI